MSDAEKTLKKTEDVDMKLEVVETTSLYQLMENLIAEDQHNGTILASDENLIAVLKTDFELDTKNFSEPEIDSYIAVLKWALNVWPSWLQTMDGEDPSDTQNIQKLMQGYAVVKKYITYLLQVTGKCITEVEEGARPVNENDRLVLKVECEKRKLNSLINSKISSRLSLVNFNVPVQEGEASNQFHWMTFMDIFCWPFMEVHVELPNFSFVHKNVSKSQYKVVNLQSAHKLEVAENDTDVYCNNKSKTKYGLEISVFLEYLNQVMKFISNCRRIKGIKKSNMTALFEEIIKDVSVLPHITIDTRYKHNLSDYNYYQYMSNHVDESLVENDELYKKYKDVQPRLQHTITPAIEFCLTKFTCTFTTDKKEQKTFNLGLEQTERADKSWLTIYCALCNVEIQGITCFDQLKVHLAELHGAENDYQCVRCKSSFKMSQLASSRWYHACA